MATAQSLVRLQRRMFLRPQVEPKSLVAHGKNDGHANKLFYGLYGGWRLPLAQNAKEEQPYSSQASHFCTV